jgi:hypothetical protein
VSGKEYLEVKWRLVWLRSEHQDAIIDTELISHQGNEAIFKAFIKIPDGGSATGYGSEDAQGFGDYIEKAETKAIGRALSALGYGTQFAGDHDYGASSGRVVDAPVSMPQRPPQRDSGTPRQVQAGPGDATDRQLAAIEAMARKLGVSIDTQGMSRQDASATIERLDAQLKQPQAMA